MDNYLPGAGDRLSALCRKHADRMSMPRDWVVDDRRTNNPTWFKVQQATPARREEPAKSRRKARPFPKPESFDTLSIVRPTVEPIPDTPVVAEPVVVEPAAVASLVTESVVVEPAVVEPVDAPVHDDDAPVVSSDALEPTQAMPWRPHFDHEDDLDGVMKPKGRLMSRAFGSDETQFMQRPKQSKDLDREPFGEHDIP
jgi:hypothetical protein